MSYAIKNETLMKERLSNIELLRILLMYMVVILHFVGHNALSANNEFHFADKNWISANLLESFSCCAVDCFVLISGYFTIKFRLSKLVVFLLPIAFYELCLSVIFYKYYGVISYTPFNYWFVKPYFLLMLVSPILNEGLRHMDKERIIYFCLICMLLCYCNTPLSEGAGKTFQIFILLYALGYSISHCRISIGGGKIWGVIFSIVSLLIFLQTCVLDFLGHYRGVQSMSYNYNNILVIVAAIALFKFFTTLNIRSRFINWVSSSAFFVYIISENYNMYMHPNGMYDILHVQEWESTSMYPILILLASAAVFIVCIYIDKVRIFLFGRVERYLCKSIDNIEGKILDFIYQKISNL